MTSREAATYVGLNYYDLIRRSAAGEIPRVKWGNANVRFRRGDLRANRYHLHYRIPKMDSFGIYKELVLPTFLQKPFTPEALLAVVAQLLAWAQLAVKRTA
jgi:hypothetical protein